MDWLAKLNAAKSKSDEFTVLSQSDGRQSMAKTNISQDSALKTNAVLMIMKIPKTSPHRVITGVLRSNFLKN